MPSTVSCKSEQYLSSNERRARPNFRKAQISLAAPDELNGLRVFTVNFVTFVICEPNIHDRDDAKPLSFLLDAISSPDPRGVPMQASLDVTGFDDQGREGAPYR